MTRTGLHTGAGLTTVETCHKALVLLRPSALSAQRVQLSGVEGVLRGHLAACPIVFQGGRECPRLHYRLLTLCPAAY